MGLSHTGLLHVSCSQSAGSCCRDPQSREVGSVQRLGRQAASHEEGLRVLLLLPPTRSGCTFLTEALRAQEQTPHSLLRRPLPLSLPRPDHALATVG